MSYPSSADLLGQVIADSDGPHVESHTIPNDGQYKYSLGSGLSPALPAGWRVIPKGAFQVNSPAAPSTSGATSTSTAFGLTPASHYKWALTNVTLFGETTLGTALDVANTGSGVTGYGVQMPGWLEDTPTNPVLKRRLYRTKAGGSSFFLVTELYDRLQTVYVDGLPDDALLTNPPVSNGSGSIGTVDVAFGLSHWTQVASSPSTGQYVVDYSLSATGGTITHAAADAGKAVTVTYTAATFVNEPLLQSVISAVKDIRGVLGTAPQGSSADLTTRLNTSLPTLDGGGHVAQAPAHGYRSLAWLEGTVLSTNSTSYTGFATSVDVALTSNGTLRLSVQGNIGNATGALAGVQFEVQLSGANTGTYPLSGLCQAPSGQTIPFHGLAHISGLNTGVTHCQLLWKLVGGGGGTIGGVPATDYYSIEFAEIG